MHLAAAQAVRIGALGTVVFPAGYYLYVGSALGPGGLAARLARHWQTAKKPHWHIDYLREVCLLVCAWARVGQTPRECDWALAVADMSGATIPAQRFGASDCSCQSHLFRLPRRADAVDLAAAVGCRPDLLVELDGALPWGRVFQGGPSET